MPGMAWLLSSRPAVSQLTSFSGILQADSFEPAANRKFKLLSLKYSLENLWFEVARTETPRPLQDSQGASEKTGKL